MLCVLDQCEFLSKKTRKKKINLWKLSKVALLLNQFLFEVFTLPYFKYLLSVFVQYARAFLNSYTQSVCVSCSAMSDSLWPHGLNPPPVRRILKARILEWVAISSCWGSSWPRDWTQVSCIAVRFFTVWTTREAQSHPIFALSMLFFEKLLVP